MDKKGLKGYMEFASFIEGFSLNKNLKDLISAANDTQILTFGWAIAPVIVSGEYSPKTIEDGSGVRVSINANESNDYWTLKKNGQFYILKSLFEDRRKTNMIFADTRTVRTAEVFLRTARLYRALNVPLDTRMVCRIEYGGLKGRVLGAANSLRIFPVPRVCAVDIIHREFNQTIGYFLEPTNLKEVVYETVLAITEMCDLFVPQKEEFIGQIIDDFLRGRIG